MLMFWQVMRTSDHRSKKRVRWRPLTRWTNVSVLPQNTNSDDDDDDDDVSNGTVQSYTVQGLALGSYYELEVRAFNDLDCSPPFRPRFVFFTHPGMLKAKRRRLLPVSSASSVVGCAC